MAKEQTGIADAVQQVSEKAQILVREEIELAKAEVTVKVTKLVKGAAVGVTAGVFAIFGLVVLLHGLAWLAWYLLFDSDNYFWGFLIIAGILFLLAGIAGALAMRFVKSGSPPKPQLAIEEGQRIKATLDEARSR